MLSHICQDFCREHFSSAAQAGKEKFISGDEATMANFMCQLDDHRIPGYLVKHYLLLYL